MVTPSSNANLLNHLEESHFYSTKFATMRKQLACECHTVSILPSNFNGLLLYSQCYIILARLKSETRGAWRFPGDIPPEGRILPDTWEEAESPRVPSSLCPVCRHREPIPTRARDPPPSPPPVPIAAPLARAPAGRAGAAPGCQRSAPDRAPLGAAGREARASRGEGAAGVAHAQEGERAREEGGARGDPRARGGALRRAAGTSLRVPQYLMSLCSPGLG